MAFVLPLLLGMQQPALARSTASDDVRQLAREILEQLIAMDTSLPDGDPGAANRAIAARLLDAGMPADDVEVVNIAGDPRLGSLVARLRGTDAASGPVIVMAHIDVVPALAEDWDTDPFHMVERDGFLFGRGTGDNKAGAAIAVTSVIRFLHEGYRPERDIVIVFTSDEETDMRSIRQLVAEHPLVRRASLALNTDAGGGEIQDGRYVIFGLQASEKVYQSYRLEVRDPGGHSSVPRESNAIYTLAEGLNRLSRHRFPVQSNEITRAYFGRAAELGGEHADDMHRVAGPERISRPRSGSAPGIRFEMTVVSAISYSPSRRSQLPDAAGCTRQDHIEFTSHRRAPSMLASAPRKSGLVCMPMELCRSRLSCADEGNRDQAQNASAQAPQTYTRVRQAHAARRSARHADQRT
jgi:acetylornithine deacetylase/succinyl-diaminopimelate desuccinylase-like protein